MAAGGRFHARWFHPTGICGVFGATAAAARLAGLGVDQTVHALGLAGSMAGGLLEFLADGSQTKPLHPGWAAHAGITAARLAAHGATGPASVLEGRRGLFAAYLHGEQADIEGQLEDLGVRWETPNIAFKPYPACHYIHAPVDALAALIGEQHLSAEDVASIVAFSDEIGVALVLNPLDDKGTPRTPYDAKFSLPYCLATRLVRGSLDVASFTAPAVADARTIELAHRVTYECRTYAPAPDAFPGGVRVTTVDGRVLEAELRYQRGGATNPMSVAEVIAKYRINAGLALPATATTALETAVLSLEAQTNLDDLAVLAAARSGEVVSIPSTAPISEGTL
jgi:2-methylcitrate dehydratase PrpD